MLGLGHITYYMKTHKNGNLYEYSGGNFGAEK
jgi:hypothetical protein